MADFASPDDTGTKIETTVDTTTGSQTEPESNDTTETTTEPPAAAANNGSGDGTGPKKRRRRGSRGGRGRKKPGPGTAAGGGAGSTRADDDDERDVAGIDDDGGDDVDIAVAGGEDWTDEAADRGLTSEDVGDEARADAGLPTSDERPRIGDSRPAPARPKIGDSRPPREGSAAVGESEGEDAPKKRRRRRGGRGRSRSGAGTNGNGNGSGSGSGSATAAPTRPAPKQPTYVDAGAAATDIDVDGTAILESLDEETLERRRGTRRKGRPAGRYLMVVHQRDDGMSHIGVLEGRTLVEHYVSLPTDDTTSIDGNIYLGRVQNVLPGMEAAFVDIGTPKNGVLYRGDVVYDDSEVDRKEPMRIERMLRNGQSIIVQVTKNPIGHKGARLTQEVSLAGRFVVMVPNQPQTYGISKRLPDDERRRLRRILDRLRPSDAGLIVRTAAEGATDEELERDMRRLNAQWQQLSELAKRGKPGSLLYKEPPLAIRLIREEFTKEYRGVVIDSPALYEEVRGYVDAIAPELADRVEYYDAVDENLPVFEKFHVHEQLHKALDRKVWLPSGGSLVIERTEALTVIDVNTGKNVGTSNLEETVYRNNLEAAEAVARELRLRDIGGIIVIDFIDMEIKANREAVEEQFREALARDKTRTQVFPISELGLLEMTRKRVSEGLVEAFSSTCPHCNGRGFVVDETMME
jgi:ribonuclease E